MLVALPQPQPALLVCASAQSGERACRTQAGLSLHGQRGAAPVAGTIRLLAAGCLQSIMQLFHKDDGVHSGVGRRGREGPCWQRLTLGVARASSRALARGLVGFPVQLTLLGASASPSHIKAPALRAAAHRRGVIGLQLQWRYELRQMSVASNGQQPPGYT